MFKTLRVFALIIAAAATAGCVQKMDLVQVVTLDADDANYGQDIYGARRAAGQASPTVRGSQVVEIRTYAEGEKSDQTNAEMAGAECLVRSDGGSARVQTPGGVRVSVYGHTTPPLDVKCIKDGFTDAVKLFPTFNLTKAERMRSASAAPGLIGLLALGATAIVNAASDETQHDFNYLMPRIVMKKGKSSGKLLDAQVTPVTAPQTDQAITTPTS